MPESVAANIARNLDSGERSDLPETCISQVARRRPLASPPATKATVFWSQATPHLFSASFQDCFPK